MWGAPWGHQADRSPQDLGVEKAHVGIEVKRFCLSELWLFGVLRCDINVLKGGAIVTRRGRRVVIPKGICSTLPLGTLVRLQASTLAFLTL
jgi:hypothetical protein